MADLVMGALPSLIPKLYRLLEKEYKLQSGVRERIGSLTKELEIAQAALRKVAEVPWDQLDKQAQLWAREVREASYDMEDVLDTILVRVQGPESAEEEQSLLNKHLKKMTNFFKKSKARRRISGDVMDIMTHLQEVTEWCRRYRVDDIVARPAAASTIDPRLHAMYTQVNKLVGIDESSSELRSKLHLDDMSNTKLKIVSIVGVGGLGKTTLAKAVYDNLAGDFNCRAFVSVGRNPDLQKVLQMILIGLDKERYGRFNFAVLQDITQFINELREFLHDNKRCLIVIDDMWEKQSWETLKLAVPNDQSCEGRIIVTTRKWEVAKNADEVYELPPLPYGSSRKLFYTRIYGDEIKDIDHEQPDEVSDEIIRKCAGIPLAIITMASLLVKEPRKRWFEVYKSVGFGCKDNEDAENIMKKILSFSYYDLPSHLRTCLLYLSAFPEDSVTPKGSLVWMWAAEGFVPNQERKGLYETGQDYLNDLINRSLIQDEVGELYCHVHDMVLDFIRSISSEENFFTVIDNHDQGTLVRSNVVRRMAHHIKTTMHSNQDNMFGMSKVRSFIALEWAIDTWVPISSFKLLRVLNLGYYYHDWDHSPLRVELLGHLLHLRFLGINGRLIEKIPEEIGALKMLQTLDLYGSFILELSSSSRLPTQLVCLRIEFSSEARDDEMFSVGRLTCLEELSIQFNGGCNKAWRRLVKELRSLIKLRVFYLRIPIQDNEMQRDLIESARHLHKLQHLQILFGGFPSLNWRPDMEFALTGDLRYLSLGVVLWKLPSCIDPLCHRKLSHLELSLLCMDDQELKTLGRLLELQFLSLDLERSSPAIRNISSSDVCYFPKLRWLRLTRSMALFVANEGDDDDGKKSVSFHIWDGTDAKLRSDDEFSCVFQWETGRGQNDDKLQLQSDDEEKKEGSISTREGDGKGEGASTTPRFMPYLQKIYFEVREQAIRDPRYCSNLGLEFLSSLQKISFRIYRSGYGSVTSMQEKGVKAALRRAAQVHPNHPTLDMTDNFSMRTYEL